MIIVEDAEMQLPQELTPVDFGGPMEDYILVAYHVKFDEITQIANGARYIALSTLSHLPQSTHTA